MDWGSSAPLALSLLWLVWLQTNSQPPLAPVNQPIPKLGHPDPRDPPALDLFLWGEAQNTMPLQGLRKVKATALARELWLGVRIFRAAASRLLAERWGSYSHATADNPVSTRPLRQRQVPFFGCDLVSSIFGMRSGVWELDLLDVVGWATEAQSVLDSIETKALFEPRKRQRSQAPPFGSGTNEGLWPLPPPFGPIADALVSSKPADFPTFDSQLTGRANQQRNGFLPACKSGRLLAELFRVSPGYRQSGGKFGLFLRLGRREGATVRKDLLQQGKPGDKWVRLPRPPGWETNEVLRQAVELASARPARRTRP